MFYLNMEFKEVVDKRRTIRDFQNKEVPQEIIEYALENGFKAPSYNHVRDWNFIILKSLESKLKLVESENLNQVVSREKLEQLLEKEDIIKKEMYLDAIPKQKKMILEAPVVIVVVFQPKTKVELAKRIYDLNCLASAWACIENILLSLAEHDVYGVTFIPQHTDMMKSLMGIPAGLEIAAVIPVGYKSINARILKQKDILLGERIHKEKW